MKPRTADFLIKGATLAGAAGVLALAVIPPGRPVLCGACADHRQALAEKRAARALARHRRWNPNHPRHDPATHPCDYVPARQLGAGGDPLGLWKCARPECTWRRPGLPSDRDIVLDIRARGIPVTDMAAYIRGRHEFYDSLT